MLVIFICICFWFRLHKQAILKTSYYHFTLSLCSFESSFYFCMTFPLIFDTGQFRVIESVIFHQVIIYHLIVFEGFLFPWSITCGLSSDYHMPKNFHISQSHAQKPGKPGCVSCCCCDGLA